MVTEATDCPVRACSITVPVAAIERSP